MSLLSENLCIVCAGPNAKRCGRCLATVYCGPKCQRKDFKVHSILCKEWTPFIETRPSPDHRVCIFFPVSSTKPELKWYDSKSANKDMKTIAGITDFTDMMLVAKRKHCHAQHTGKTAYSFGEKLVISEASNARTNKCMEGLTDQDLDSLFPGNRIVALRESRTSAGLDCGLDTLSIVVDLHRAGRVLHIKNDGKIPKGYVRGVKLPSQADMDMFGWPFSFEVAVRLDDDIFNFDRARKPKMMRDMGLPVLMRRSLQTHGFVHDAHLSSVGQAYRQEVVYDSPSTEDSYLARAHGGEREEFTYIAVRQDAQPLTKDEFYITAISIAAQGGPSCTPTYRFEIGKKTTVGEVLKQYPNAFKKPGQ